MALREWLWETLYAGRAEALMPETLPSTEILGALIMAGLILAGCWLGIRKALFRLAESARASRQASLVFGVLLAVAWLIGALEWGGVDSVRWMLVLMLVTTVGTVTYLIWVKHS